MLELGCGPWAAGARRRAPRRRRARHRLGGGRDRAAAPERRAQLRSRARRARPLERSGAAAPRRALGPRPRRRPPLRGAKRRAARRAPSAVSAASCCSPNRGGRTQRSSSTVRGRVRWRAGLPASLLSRVAALALTISLAVAPKPHVIWKPIPYGPERKAGDGRVRREALRHPTPGACNPKVIVEHYTASNSFSPAWNTFALHARPGAGRAPRHVRALHRRPGRQDLPARAPERHVPPHRRAQLRRHRHRARRHVRRARSCATRPRSARRSSSPRGSSIASTSGSAT